MPALGGGDDEPSKAIATFLYQNQRLHPAAATAAAALLLGPFFPDSLPVEVVTVDVRTHESNDSSHNS